MDNIKEMLMIANFNRYEVWRSWIYSFGKVEGMFKLPYLISFNASDTEVSKAKVIGHWLKAFNKLSWLDKMYFILTNFARCICVLIGIIYKLIKIVMIATTTLLFIALILAMRWGIVVVRDEPITPSWKWDIVSRAYSALWINRELLVLAAIVIMILTLLMTKLEKSNYKNKFADKIPSVNLITIWTKTTDGIVKPIDFIYTDSTSNPSSFYETENVLNIIIREKTSVDELRRNFNELNLFDRFLLSSYHKLVSDEIFKDKELMETVKYEYYKRKGLDLEEISELRGDVNVYDDCDFGGKA